MSLGLMMRMRLESSELHKEQKGWQEGEEGVKMRVAPSPKLKRRKGRRVAIKEISNLFWKRMRVEMRMRGLEIWKKLARQ